MSDDDWITEEMDDYFLGSEVEEECVDPDGYSYVDPETGLTPKQQAYLAYKQALDEYDQNWVGTPWWARTEDPPRWEDFWQEPVYEQPYRPSYRPKPTISDKIGMWVIAIIAAAWIGFLIWFFVFWLA